jgi:hypothetical protein
VTLFETTEDVSTFANDPSSFYAGGNMVVDLPGNSILQIGGQVFFGDGGMSVSVRSDFQLPTSLARHESFVIPCLAPNRKFEVLDALLSAWTWCMVRS